MSAAEIGYLAASGAVAIAVTTTGIVAARVLRPAAEAVCAAVRGGYSVTLSGPSLRLDPPKPPPPAAAEAVPQPSERGRSPYANDAWKDRPRAKGGQFASAGEKVPAPVQAAA